MSDAITPFRIAASDAQLDDLRRRLRATRWPEREAVDDWSQGIPLAYVQEVCAYWAEKYDWRAREARLNALPAVQDRDRRPRASTSSTCARRTPNALPLVITHGWPGSIVEFQQGDRAAHGSGRARRRRARRLPRRRPSLPGYGFSDKPAKSGWDVERIARGLGAR